jgi:hypothetical protein
MERSGFPAGGPPWPDAIPRAPPLQHVGNDGGASDCRGKSRENERGEPGDIKPSRPHRGESGLGVQATRIQASGPRTNFSDTYQDPLSRWAQEVWAKPLLYCPGTHQPYGFALAFVNHGQGNASISVGIAVLAQAFPQYFAATAQFEALELWSGQAGGDIGAGDAVSWEVEPDGVGVVTLNPGC